MNGKQKWKVFVIGGLTIAAFSPHSLSYIQANELNHESVADESGISSIQSESNASLETKSSLEASAVPESNHVTESTTELKTAPSATPKESYSSSEMNQKDTQTTSSNEINSSNKVSESTKENKSSDSLKTQASKENVSNDQGKKEVTEEKTLPAVIKKEKVEENYQSSIVKNHTTTEFIQAIGLDAQVVAWENDLYASVMIAQAILETGSGNSQLSRAPYFNLFGIKGSYQGQSVNFSTSEDNGSGSLYTIKSNFRKYPSYKESLVDYADLLKGGISGNRTFYQQTWKINAPTYKDATAFLTGRYATDTSYDKKLNSLIETYNLTSFDQSVQETSTSDTKEKVTATTESKEEVNDAITGSVASITMEESEPTDLIYHREWPASVASERKWYAWSSARQQAMRIEGKQLISEGIANE